MSDNNSQYDVFISYSRKNKDAVSAIKGYLESQGFSCWMDLEGIESGSREFSEHIINAIDASSAMLFFLSAESQESEWALKEIDYATDEHKHVVIVRFNDDQMTKKFRFEFKRADIIDLRIPEQRGKLLRDLRSWAGNHSERYRSPGSEIATQPHRANYGNLNTSRREANKLYAQGKYKQVLPFYHQLAARGDVDAQTKLATMYFNGYGVKKNKAEAMKWVRKAAEQGDVWAEDVIEANSFRSKIADFMGSEAFAYFWVFLFYVLIALIVGFYVWSRFF